MKYLVVQDWSNTRGNHAGMEHMCDLLVERWPNEYTKICKGEPSPIIKRENILLRKLLGRYDKYIHSKKWKEEYMQLCKVMFESLKSGDEVFLLEYNWPATSQLEIAKYIKKNFTGIRIHALSHITPTLFRQLHYEKLIKSWSQYVDTELTMGTGLSSYFEKCGVENSRISTGFHYVDNNYYTINEKDIQLKERPTIIVMGALQRNYSLLADIVNCTPEVDWIICKGRKKVEHLFFGENIRLVGYVPEDDLRSLMAESDASLNVFEDTVGSNVITTSLAMGLAIIVSDVGSIRDHVDESCGIFCKNNVEDFVVAIKRFAKSPDRIVSMRKAALKRTTAITIDKVYEWFSLLTTKCCDEKR